ETAGQGTDSVYVSASYALAAGRSIERMATTSLAGNAALSLKGNEFAQAITGNSGANTLSGLGGNDTLNGYSGTDILYGGSGNDVLTGGGGPDYFVFDTALSPTANVDRITDLLPWSDKIRLDNAVMPGLGATLGTLAAGKFWASGTGVAHDSDDRIIYETDTGKLFYDSNGNASGGAVHFATLSPNLALTNADFAVI
ncbi:calcium-binding protein, partial [Rhizobiaceae sp. 2RAB30]